MNNTLRPSPVLHAFKSLWQWLMAKPGQPAPEHSAPLVSAPQAASLTKPDATASSQTHQIAVATPQATLGRPVRVLRVLDAGQSPALSGRLRISGRMADVCAELDRLAAREALQH